MGDTITLGLGLNHDWQKPSSGDPLTGDWWRRLLARIDGRADYLTLHDPFGGGVPAFEPGILAARLGPLARDIALIPGTAATRTEPFHASTTIATLDYITRGRAGVWIQPSSEPGAPGVLGALNGYPPEEAGAQEQDLLDAAEAIRQLWDSWQDDAVIRDTGSQRFLDADRLHPIRFRGRHFSVHGPSMTPRPPQGQPVLAVSAHDPATLLQAIAVADVVFLQPGAVPPGDFIAGARWAAQQAGREGVRFILDVAVSFDGPPVPETPALVWTGSAASLGTLAPGWIPHGFHGLRFLPRDPARDLSGLLEVVFPALDRAGLLPARRAGDLRGRFGLGPAQNRFAA